MEIRRRPIIDHPHARWMRSASVLTLASALVLIGPVMAAEAQSAEAQSSAARANVVARAAVPASGVTLETEEAELTKADIDLVVKVRLAGLWEIPAGKMAMTKGASPRVREVGQMIASQHVRLDALDKTAAKELGVKLPDRPTGQQARWLDEMAAATGAAFDDLFVMRLRIAHGSIFPVIGVVRATTDSEVVRKLAQSSNNFVLTHITLLESTGLVRYEELPKGVAPVTEPAGATRSRSGGLATSVIWMILAAALLTGAFVTTRMIRPQVLGGRPGGALHGGSPAAMGPRSTVQPVDNFYPQHGLRLGSGSSSRS